MLALLASVLFLAPPGTTLAAQAQTTGSTDYDVDNDGLIEISSLAQLDAIRWDLDGDGAASDTDAYARAFSNAVSGMGCPSDGCAGYEVVADLDFDTSSQYPMLKNVGTSVVARPGETAAPSPPVAEQPAANRAPCPAPGSPAAAAPTPRPVPTVRGDYDADDDGLIEVATLAQLNAMRYDLEGTGSPSNLAGYYQVFPGAVAGMGCPDTGCAGYELVTDLDFDTNANGRADPGDAYWNDGDGWLPIGNSRSSFNTTFDGGHHIISNLHINREGQSEVGLFGHVTGTIRNIGLVSVNVTGSNHVGGLVGDALYVTSSTITASYTTGDITGRINVGGLVGSDGYISASCSAAIVTGYGRVGGLVGSNGRGFYKSSVSASYATGDVTGSGNSVGGLVGYGGEISASYATGDVTGGGSGVGGLVGFNQGVIGKGSISTSYATGDVMGLNSVGGLVGGRHSYSLMIISTSHATGDVTGGGSNVGGLIGSNSYESPISASYATGNVTGGGDNVGGLVGFIGSDYSFYPSYVNASYATGDVTGGGDNVGGLVGRNFSRTSSTIMASHAVGDVTGRGNNAGGLVGSNNRSIIASYATGGVTGGEGNAGGLGKVGSNVGGLVGDNDGSIIASYATGDVTGGEGNAGDLGEAGSNVGGLVGDNDGSIMASYATGAASGNLQVGGLAGNNEGGIRSSYSTGKASGIGAIGGLVGNSSGTVTDSYWDTASSGVQHSDGGQGKTTSELQSPTGYNGIYTGWNLDLDNDDRDRDLSTGSDDPWDFGTSSQYPVLKYGGLDVSAQRERQNQTPTPPMEDISLGPPTNVRVNPVGSGLVNVGWDKAPGAAGYTIIAINIADPAKAPTKSVNNPDAVAGQIGNLTVGAQYNIYVASFDAALDFALDFSEKKRVTVE